MNEPRVFDIGDVGFFDRYTVVIGNDVYSMSDNPLSPNGFNQYYDTRDTIIGHTGGEVAIKDLPEDVQKAIKQRMKSV